MLPHYWGQGGKQENAPHPPNSFLPAYLGAASLESAMPLPPTGTVTFLFTDIEGSTKLWEQRPDAMRPALARHEDLLRGNIETSGGYVFKTVGDAFCAAFPTANAALQAALAAQLALAVEPWETETPLSVRMALHTGATEERGGDYFGPPLNRVARLMAAGYGGQVLLSEVTRGLVRDALPPNTSLLGLDQHRLKDLGRPEQVFQLLHPSLPADFPRLRSLDNPALPNNLPQQVSSFIGREREIAEVKALLGKTRLLTLTGAGGGGKTRLSLQVAADLLTGDGDGVWLVELAALADPALVPQAVADVLGIKEGAGQPIQRTLVEALKAKRLLLILDNCEHLVVACASLAADLLRACPDLHILASSREPLNVSGEQTYRVPSLSLPDPKQAQTVESLSQFEGVRLFVERAQAVQPSFAVTSASAPAVAQICWRLDGIPLAIELAAARVRSLSVEEINARLDSRFRLLTGGSRVALPRQQTLRALIDWSYDLLNAQEKLVLLRTCVFAGGWTIPAAEAVCAGDGVEQWEVLDLLAALVDKSLVVTEPAGDRTRYRLLETVRQYAEECLRGTGEAERRRDRHLSWCVALAEAASSQLRGSEQGMWLARLETEHDNLRAALAWGDGAATGPHGATRLVAALCRFWYVRGHWSEGRSHLEAALARNGMGQETQAQMLGTLGFLVHSLGESTAGRTSLEQALTINRAIGNQSRMASNLIALGFLTLSQGQIAAARAFFEQSLVITREIGDRRDELINLNGLGNIAYEQGEAEAARSCFVQALAISREIGERRGEAGNLNGLGNIARDLGESAAARSWYEQSLTITREIGERWIEASNLNGLGGVVCGQGDCAEARFYVEQSLAITRQIGDRSKEVWNLSDLGQIFRLEGDLVGARAFCVESLTLASQLGEITDITYTVEERAALAMAENVPQRAARLAGAAQAAREGISASLPPRQRRTHEQTMAAARAALGDEVFSDAWYAGRAMTMDQAVEYALADGEPQR